MPPSPRSTTKSTAPKPARRPRSNRTKRTSAAGPPASSGAPESFWKRSWAVVVGLSVAIGLVVTGIGIDWYRDGRGGETATSATGGGTVHPALTTTTVATTAAPAGTADATASSTAPPASPPSGPDAAAGAVTVLPAPSGQEHCRPPRQASGAAWQLGHVRAAGQDVEAVTCALLSGYVGAVEFDIAGKGYTRLEALVGLSDRSNTAHVVRFELFGDGAPLLQEPPSVGFGPPVAIAADVSGVARLRLSVTEAHAPTGSDPASDAFLGAVKLS